MCPAMMWPASWWSQRLWSRMMVCIPVPYTLAAHRKLLAEHQSCSLARFRLTSADLRRRAEDVVAERPDGYDASDRARRTENWHCTDRPPVAGTLYTSGAEHCTLSH